MFKIKPFIITLMITISVFLGCSENNLLDSEGSGDPRRGDIISTYDMGTYTPELMKQAFRDYGLPDTFNFTYAVTVTRVFYYTEDLNGNIIHVSGAIINPITDRTLPLLSLHHGTQTKRDMVVSQKPLELAVGLAGILTASNGYVVVLPDYPGLGFSQIMHPFLLENGIIPSVIDLIRAAKIYCKKHHISLNEKLFLTGYSEGGYVTLATLKSIEQQYSHELEVTATAPLGGVYDLHDVARTILNMEEFPWPHYIGYIFTAYDHYYRWNCLNEIFREPYSINMTEFYNGEYYDYQINQELPRQLGQFIDSYFRQNFMNGNETRMINAFKENSLLDWAPRSPLLFIHGDQDISAPYSSAIRSIDSLRSQTESTVDLLVLEGLNHEEAGLAAIIEMIKWFNTF